MTEEHPGLTDESPPTHADFNPWGHNALDAEYAWRIFGGLTLNEAREKFLDRPDLRQEDFMFMGGKAFSFYFPIIDDYLREVPEDKVEGEERQAWILASCIEQQFKGNTLHHVLHLAPRIISLSQFVRDNIGRFGDDESEQASIWNAWVELDASIKAAVQAMRSGS